MWDTRSIIVRFRRQRGNTCLPGEPKPNVKKTKEEPNSNSQIKKCQKVNYIEKSVTKLETEENKVQDNCNKMQNKTSQIQEQNTNLQSSSSSSAPTSITSSKSGQQQQPWVQVYCINIEY